MSNYLQMCAEKTFVVSLDAIELPCERQRLNRAQRRAAVIVFAIFFAFLFSF